MKIIKPDLALGIYEGLKENRIKSPDIKEIYANRLYELVSGRTPMGFYISTYGWSRPGILRTDNSLQNVGLIAKETIYQIMLGFPLDEDKSMVRQAIESNALGKMDNTLRTVDFKNAWSEPDAAKGIEYLQEHVYHWIVSDSITHIAERLQQRESALQVIYDKMQTSQEKEWAERFRDLSAGISQLI